MSPLKPRLALAPSDNQGAPTRRGSSGSPVVKAQYSLKLLWLLSGAKTSEGAKKWAETDVKSMKGGNDSVLSKSCRGG